MLINETKIRSLRSDRGWTQQNLADACQVSLRTIQRVERTGSASLDTLKGLCAVFEVEQDFLYPKGATKDSLHTFSYLGLSSLLSGLIGGLVGALLMYFALTISS
ncbi:helix-turn-helix transcriptional regulator [Temperatibacter marinus]|uniref:Helix-turn-helix transcriptional regulator n=1 Tax=Temperatibacter marinus TaxID=1456591 RepID=A0AA52ECH0_9PROT|nr:helix-turn-helix transcriptional regulator [Temperatibacter marinus]WND02867.1 helix-turn-helix transcriptional regulator [Temperatibacter marinus]